MPKLDFSRPSTIIGLILLAGFAVFTLYEIVTAGDIWVATTLKALALGAVYSMIALGFVLIYKATEVVNFSQGALAMIAYTEPRASAFSVVAVHTPPSVTIS